MITTSRKPTTDDLANKARLLYRIAAAAQTRARETNYDTPKQTIDELSDFTEIFADAAKELYILCEVFADYSSFSDFPECAAVYTEQPPAGADQETPERKKLIDDLTDSIIELADGKKKGGAKK